MDKETREQIERFRLKHEAVVRASLELKEQAIKATKAARSADAEIARLKARVERTEEWSAQAFRRAEQLEHDAGALENKIGLAELRAEGWKQRAEQLDADLETMQKAMAATILYAVQLTREIQNVRGWADAFAAVLDGRGGEQ